MAILATPTGGTSGLIAVPILALALMAGEYLLARYRHERVHDLGETTASLVIAVGHRITSAATASLAMVPAAWVYQHRLFDIPLAEPWALLALFLGVEFCYYWQHVAMHKVRWFWATHAVHHSATYLNLSAAIRLGWGGSLTGGFLFFLPMVWLGFAPLAVVAALSLGLFYQFFLHAAWAPRLGWLEWILNTPSHHRVHHASNEACLDRNFGGVLIVFDRLFGTFAEAPQGERLHFGIKGGAGPTRGPLRIVLAGWVEMARALRTAGDWPARWTTLFGRPAAIAALLLMVTAAPSLAFAADVEWKLPFGGRDRTYTVHLPAHAMDGAPLPLVVVLHGGAGNGLAAARQTQFSDAADAAGFIVVYPNGTDRARPFLNAMGKPGFLTWNAGRCCGYAMQNGVDDVGFVRSMVAQLEQNYPIDRRRIYATGISNGGMMAYRLAADASKRVAAIASVAGQVEVTKFAPKRPVPVMEFHSVDDPRALYNGGLGLPFPGTMIHNQFDSVQDGIDRWVTHDGCRHTPDTGPTLQGQPGTTDQGETATQITYAPCKQDAQVVLWKLTGAGHVWPGTPIDLSGAPRGAVLGQPTNLVDANELMWEFFSKYQLPKR
jgi:poly(3-hydroxybutyrate) depolymerase/sterol desaturase/sphingolipid hydroxylase (fatty acid hydroxylase superfamily)